MIRMLMNFYTLLLIVDAVLSFFPDLRSSDWAKWIKKAADFTCRPIRKLMPQDLPFDFSPLVVIVLMNFVKVLW